jgi:antitoxin component of RelBE/YafQ-DinJ toxin-antitoxin module
MIRDARLHIRISKSVKRQAEKKAEALGFSLSEYIRHLIRLDTAKDLPKK